MRNVKLMRNMKMIEMRNVSRIAIMREYKKMLQRSRGEWYGGTSRRRVRR